ncbi:MAG: ParA family protein [Deltaproteobacteria bacterium]|nr:ParA family protein [Deltaproteobacteria bacterium]
MNKVIVVGNLKGGTGKSTLAVNLAAALGGYLLDADLQATASEWLAQGLLPVEGRFMPIRGGEVAPWLKEVFKIALRPLVIDLPSNLGPNTAAALAVADLAVLPVTPSTADVRATEKALELLRESRRRRRDGRPRALLAPSKLDLRTRAGREFPALLASLGEKVAPAVSQRMAHVEACAAGRWVGDFAPGSPAHKEILALAQAVAEAAG